MANIAGVGFGTVCDHIVRRFVILHYDGLIGFYVDVPADIDNRDHSIQLYVNNEPFLSATARVEDENLHRALFGNLGGFGFGGFGEGGFGSGGFNVGISIADLGGFPIDDVELEFKTTPRFCPKCILRDDMNAALPATSLGIGYGGNVFNRDEFIN